MNIEVEDIVFGWNELEDILMTNFRFKGLVVGDAGFKSDEGVGCRNEQSKMNCLLMMYSILLNCYREFIIADFTRID